MKTRHRRTTKATRKLAPISARRSHSPAADLQEQLDRRTSELDEALAHQIATSEVLSVISRSPADAQPVFDAIVESAARLCGAMYSSIYLSDDGRLRIAASKNYRPQAINQLHALRERLEHPVRFHLSGRAMLDRTIIHVSDVLADPEYSRELALAGGWRAVLAVPLLRDGEPVGAVSVAKAEPTPFSDRQIQLLKTFADYALIAIENVRLFEAEQQRTRELSESLERQTATSDVLSIISSSPGEVEPVFEAMLAKATHLCEAKFGALYLFEGGGFRVVAVHGSAPPSFVEARRKYPLLTVTPGTALGRVAATRQTVQISDAQAEPAYRSATAHSIGVETGGLRTVLSVPMLKEGELIGAFNLFRQEVRPFTDKQIEVVTNFAAQAVIAIENTRLLNELRQRTTDLTESLEQQTGTAEVLKVISSSPGKLEPVFESLLANAKHLCGAKFGALFLREGDAFRTVAVHGSTPEYSEARRYAPLIQPAADTGLGRVLKTRQAVQIPDIHEVPGYLANPVQAPIVQLAGARTMLSVPMLKEEELLGVIEIFRTEVNPFTKKQVELVQSFAAQAVIAIENTRLLNELRQRTDDLSEALEQQTATSEVLKVISSSPGELEPVFHTVLENAVNLCEAKFGTLFLFDGTCFRGGANFNVPAPLADYQVKTGAFVPPPGLPLARLVETKKVAHMLDDPEGLSPATRLGGARTHIAVPMLKEGKIAGAIYIYRQEVKPFADKQIALVQNFASQAVIAIENARLLNELRQSLEQQTATSEILSSMSGSVTDTKPVFDAILRNLLRLFGTSYATVDLLQNGIIHLAALDGEPGFERLAAHFPLPLDDTTIAGRVILLKQAIQFAPLIDNPAAPPATARFAREYGYNSILAAPMIRGDEVIGGIVTGRRGPIVFDDKQVELIKSFAAQAVIAIENARLLNELRQSLQQQTATADVLKIISRSTFDLKTVLNTLVESAARLCEADMASVPRVTGGIFDHFATYGYSPDFHEFLRSNPILPGRGSASGRAVAEGKTIHIPDVLADPEYDYTEGQKAGGFRAVLAVPLMREGAATGVLVLGRSAPRPFTPQQIELVETFADQAVIAIENVRLFDEIQDKSRQLEEASQHKSQFLANMSHELRTPLNAILGYTELMADGAYGEPSEKMLGILKRLEANGKHLLGLINDVLDLSKIEAGQLVLELSDYCVQDVVQTARSTLEPLASDKKLAFKLELAPNLPPGHGDGRRLTQVLINLVGNAIKFTDTGEVAIKADANNGSFHVSVRDTGPGISAVDQAKLFQEFQQADNAITRKKGGTGLGLAISKRIIEMHGGRIWVESQPGQGSTFAFTLPVIVERQVEPV